MTAHGLFDTFPIDPKGRVFFLFSQGSDFIDSDSTFRGSRNFSVLVSV